jgi:hypothetical protein
MNIRERITCSINQAGLAGSWGRTTTNKLIKDGKLETIKIGGRRLVKVASLLRLLEADDATGIPAPKRRKERLAEIVAP